MNIENKGEELKISYDDFKSQVISDYKIAVTSRGGVCKGKWRKRL